MMRTKFIALAGAAVLGVSAVIGAAAFNGAEAQATRSAPVILILDQARVIAASKAGQSVKPQLEKLQETANKELNDQVASLTKEAEDLQKQRELLSEEVWTQRAQQVAIKQNNLPVLRDVKLKELSLSEQKAVGEISEAMRPILKKIVEANGATLMLERSAVMYYSEETDISAQVIAELDKKLKSVKVEKVDLQELQRKAQEAQKKAAEKKKK